MSDIDELTVPGAAHASARPFAPEIYFQTTEFTCGPATLMMAMAALDPAYAPNRLDELKIWREANLIFMGDGHAGCGPHGLACAAIKRGYDAEIYEHEAEHLFQPWTNSGEEARVQRLLAADDRKKALRRGCRIIARRLTKELIRELLAQNKQLITLTSKGVEAHWVMVHDFIDNNVFVIDPYKASGPEQNAPYRTDSGRSFIRYVDFDEWIRHGPKNSSVLLALGKKKTG